MDNGIDLIITSPVVKLAKSFYFIVEQSVCNKMVVSFPYLVVESMDYRQKCVLFIKEASRKHLPQAVYAISDKIPSGHQRTFQREVSHILDNLAKYL